MQQLADRADPGARVGLRTDGQRRTGQRDRRQGGGDGGELAGRSGRSRASRREPGGSGSGPIFSPAILPYTLGSLPISRAAIRPAADRPQVRARPRPAARAGWSAARLMPIVIRAFSSWASAAVVASQPGVEPVDPVAGALHPERGHPGHVGAVAADSQNRGLAGGKVADQLATSTGLIVVRVRSRCSRGWPGTRSRGRGSRRECGAALLQAEMRTGMRIARRHVGARRERTPRTRDPRRAGSRPARPRRRGPSPPPPVQRRRPIAWVPRSPRGLDQGSLGIGDRLLGVLKPDRARCRGPGHPSQLACTIVDEQRRLGADAEPLERHAVDLAARACAARRTRSRRRRQTAPGPGSMACQRAAHSRTLLVQMASL